VSDTPPSSAPGSAHRKGHANGRANGHAKDNGHTNGHAAPDDWTALIDRRVAVIGLGYVGLPLAAALARAGREVLGIDISQARLDELSAGRSPIEDISDAELRPLVNSGAFVVGRPDQVDLRTADAIFVCVPTPVTGDHQPDLGPVLAAAATIRAGLRAGQLIVLQSTTYPGTTNGPFRAVLEESGLRAGADFELAFAPERINPGDPSSNHVARLVGGSTPAATTRAAALLRLVSPLVHELPSAEEAELAKLFENTFRNINIGLVNQLALMCERMGLDVWRVLEAAATKPFGFMPFFPGPGVGGHCIPVDPHYLAWRARQVGMVDRFVELSTEINESMPAHVVDLVSQALASRGSGLGGSVVGLVGVAFKPNVGDVRETPADRVVELLRAAGAEVIYHDPHVPVFGLDGAGLPSVGLDELIARSDAVCVLTAHRAIDWQRLYATAPLVVDTVNSSAGRAAAGDVLVLGAGWRSGRAAAAGAAVAASAGQPIDAAAPTISFT
jgi:UDP-N-acetyl-D-glucosamine dehydrogenase